MILSIYSPPPFFFLHQIVSNTSLDLTKIAYEVAIKHFTLQVEYRRSLKCNNGNMYKAGVSPAA